MFKKVLIANRGEIALRVLRACKEMDIKTVAVHSTADTNAMHVKLADESVCIGPPQASDSYLNIPSVIAACEITGADAVHPGYGFLSENYHFAEILEAHDISFIGPSSKHISLMGDKITAKETVKKLGIPVVPGSDGDIKNIDEAKRIAKQIGYPILIKAASGGGGRGMKIAKDESEINEAFVMAKTEAKAAFSDDTVYIEKYLQKPRHIEIQVFGDSNGNAVYLGERDCSLQRRNQKILEEAPSPIITEAQREKIGNISAKAISDLRYEGAGTIEFLFENNEFYFIEMNTRLQVEHPVTEMITGLDLVKEQINIASGKDLSFKQDDINYKGHAIECRINSENPRTFIPSAGKVEFYHPPGGLGIRIDSAVYTGYSVPPYYDSLIGKLIIVADNRVECLSRLKRALDEFVIEGIETTIPLFRELIQNEDIIKGDYDIHWLEKYLSEDA
ncbi:acetyl-CoA carboxylase biotin carboxylase subunit [Hyphomicrobiales bacterium]|jgi:acetyl-CoA carboxylase biotin carboxylase subunit|nr:acetyl-CoA carboxylase biotin carboxylase subunit [Hyphomicrobiales bacterium]MDC0139731.1 acetyl-CoA carboxylase biotin carboxylase subunit [Hyphomicrobiales bacterium]MDC3272607.1 acetyl-CoA carboxylase biotin carboxylase subunit [Hyphomicrobiales bacterium]